jgi:hypothetical protein
MPTGPKTHLAEKWQKILQKWNEQSTGQFVKNL